MGNNVEKILIVTASPDLQQELYNSLSPYILIMVNNAKEAINALKDHQDISAVLVGIFLEETKGFELLNYFKAHKNFYTGPVLVITDSITDDVIDKVRDYDVFDFVVRYSDDIIIKTRIRNAVVYYVEKRKLLTYAVEQVYQNLNDTKILITLLAQIVEFKNLDCGKHVEQIGLITRILCKQLMQIFPEKYNLSDRDIEYITLASALHDIGKVYIPSEILNKPGKLTSEEMEIMKMHTLLGADIIDKVDRVNRDRPVIKYARDICLSHHERFDGKGYPNHLIENNIPIWAQIVSIADCYDALTSDRVYRKAIDHQQAIDMILNGQCGIFNPDLLACLSSSADTILQNKKNKKLLDITKESIYDIVQDICKVR